MPIINYNSIINPIATNGGTGSNPAPPNANASNSSGILLPLPAPIKQPIQIIGLVPLWPCCGANGQLQDTRPAQGGFSTTLYGSPLSGYYTFQLVIGGVTYPAVNIPAGVNTTVTAIEALINASIVSIGVTCTIVVTSGTLTPWSSFISIVATLIAPSGSGASYNGTTVGYIVSDLKIYNVIPFSGGIGTSNVSNPCLCDCREGLFTSDQLPDDREYTLPVFADLSCDDSYHNDFNSWLLSFPGNLNPISNGFFKLKKLIGTTYTTVATLNNSTYGTPLSNVCGQVCNLTLNSGTLIVGNTYTIVDYLGDNFTNVGASSNANGITFVATGTTPTTWTNGSVLSSSSPCTNVNYGGFILSWQAVLAAFGPGTYIFYVGGGTTIDLPSYCLSSSPFCLKAFDCYACDSTVKFEANYDGGNFGSVTTQGQSWSLCCTQSGNVAQVSGSSSFPWADSIRFYGEFGYETAEFERDFVKYATGIINKVRDEAIKKFMLKTEKLPTWLHERFYAYGLMADQLYVSDYNINNPNYNYKHFWVVADGNYTPQYTNWSRYSKIQDLAFKEGDQFVFRDRCCG
jgi:hypothetical protein